MDFINLTALNLPETFASARDIDETESQVSIEPAEDLTVPLEDHRNANRSKLAVRFPQRRIGKLGVMYWKKHQDRNFKPLHASYLRYNLLEPAIYRSGYMLKPGSMNEFVELARAYSEVEDAMASEIWSRIRSQANVRAWLAAFPGGDKEADFRGWLESLCAMISAFIPSPCDPRRNEVLLGMKGALPYTDADRNGLPLGPIRSVGYIGFADFIFRRKGKIFGVVEFKRTHGDINQVWYRAGAVLPQIICWIGGSSTGRIGLVVCELGYKLIYRIQREWFDVNRNPVFDYYIYPPDQRSNNHSTFRDCRPGPQGDLGRYELLKILFEILLNTFSETGTGLRHFDSPTAINQRTPPLQYRRETPLTAERATRSEVFNLGPVHMSQDFQNENIEPLNSLKELEPHVEDDIEEETKNIVEECRYSIALSDGTFKSFIGYDLPLNFYGERSF